MNYNNILMNCTGELQFFKRFRYDDFQKGSFALISVLTLYIV